MFVHYGNRSKKFSIYDTYTAVFLPVVLVLLCALSVGVSVFFVKRFLVDDCDPVVFLLLAVLNVPWVYALASMWKSGFMQRLFLRLRIDESGIQGFLFGRKLYELPWADIRTFGVVGFSFSYVSGAHLLFSVQKDEYAPRTLPELNRVCHGRIIVQYRSDVWDALVRVMPTDMGRKLGEALSKKQDCFHKR